jgi:DNA-binding transcriptional regulator LsrR (DeoR family)
VYRNKVGYEREVEDLEYADDVCLLAHRFTDIKGKLDDLGKGAQAVGLHLSKRKTKEMGVHNITDTRLQHGEEETEEV